MDERPCMGSPPRLLAAGSLLSSATEAYEQAYQKTLRDESIKDSGLFLNLPSKIDIGPLPSKFGDIPSLSSKVGSGDLRDFLPRGDSFPSDGLRRPGSATDASPHFGNSGLGFGTMSSSAKQSGTIQLAPGDRVEVTLKSPGVHREKHIELAPGEKIEISSPRASRETWAEPRVNYNSREGTSSWLSPSLEAAKCSREFLPSAKQGGAPYQVSAPSANSYAQVASSHLERENERQRMEIMSLKQEIETLLRTNAMLQTQLDVEKKRRGSDDLHSSIVAADGEKRVAWTEERRGLEKAIMELQEKCRALEMEKMVAQTKLTGTINQRELSDPALEKTEIAQKLRLEESARTAAEQRVRHLEDQLARSQAQGEELRRRLPEVERSKSEEHRRAKELETQVDSLKATSEEQEKTLSECSDRVLQGQRDLQGIRSDYEILLKTNEALKQENARLKDDSQAAKEKVRNAESEISTLKSQFSKNENDLSQKVEQLASMAHSNSEALEHKKRHYEEQDMELTKWKTECMELKSHLAALRTDHDHHKDGSSRREADLTEQLTSWKQKHSNLMAEKELLGAQLDGALQEKHDLAARNQDYFKQCEEASKALMLERKRTQDVNDRSKNMVIEMERRGQVLMRQLEDQKQQNADLKRELSAACEAARMVQVHPRARQKSSSKYSAEAPTPEKAVKGKKDGWSAVVTRMQKELDDLQQWKGSALGSLQKSHGNMEYLQSKYKRQLQYNRQLQQRLEELGRHAKEAVSHVEQSHSGPGHSSDDDLSPSPSAIPKPSRNGSMPTGTSNDLVLGSDHPEDVLEAALGHSSSMAGLGTFSKDHRSMDHQRSMRSEPVRIPAGHVDPALCFAGPDLPEHGPRGVIGKLDARAGNSCVRRHDYSEFSSSTMDGDSQASSSLFDTWPSSHGVFYETAMSVDRTASRSFTEGKTKRRSNSSGPATRARRREETPKKTIAKLMSKASAKSL